MIKQLLMSFSLIPALSMATLAMDNEPLDESIGEPHHSAPPSVKKKEDPQVYYPHLIHRPPQDTPVFWLSGDAKSGGIYSDPYRLGEWGVALPEGPMDE